MTAYLDDDEYERAAARSAFVQEGRERAQARRANGIGEHPSVDLSGWPDPRLLPDAVLAPVAPFDFALMPDSLRGWVQDIATRMQCAPDYVAATVVTALGVVIGRRVGVRPKRLDDWIEFANLWACVIGRPGTLKSPAMQAALAPLRWLDMRFNERFADELADYEARTVLLKMRRSAEEKRVEKLLKGNPDAQVERRIFADDSPPALRRLLVNDATVEKLGEILAENPNGIGVYRDELVSLFRSLDREGQEGARGFYLTGWSGNHGYSVDRIGRGHVHIPAICLAVIGSTQPGKILDYLRDATSGGANDDGLMQRFGLLVWPDVPRDPWENVDTEPDATMKQMAFVVFERLMTASPVYDWRAEYPLDHAGDPDESQPPFLRLDEVASEVFIEWRRTLEDELRCGALPEAVEAHLSKYRKLVPALALIFHLADNGRGPINAPSIERAIAWARYLRTHAQRAYGMCLVTPLDRARALLERIEKGRLPSEPFAVKKIYDAGWSRLATRDEAQQAVDVLVDHGYLVVAEAGGKSDSETGGRPREARYAVNPKATRGSY
ncbi:YfjI family protein [Paraburkholderia saeva]|uniref:YfjI family protein n=1 Tax=Paraburkholderia saeva TaxID=2777537 RepID=UPI001DFADC99|nr:YfjI family protein [Paraburkholderia saeva]CAG4924660.1 hypothetical protein R52603_05288 [Paraburkholderia saeva]